MSENYIPPDLSAILRTLAQHSGQQPASATADATTGPPTHSSGSANTPYPAYGINSTTYPNVVPHPPRSTHLTTGPPTYPSTTVPHRTHPNTGPSTNTHLSTAASHPPHTTAPIDPSRITSYPSALRYTSSLLTQNTALTTRIKKLIRTQHEHERTWWAGRKTVLSEREKRMEGRKAVNDVLRALGGVVGEEGVGTEEEALRKFDEKVYAASLEMERDVRRQLREMGIPGFVIRRELVGEGEGRVSNEGVRELEGRVVRLLEDLCGE